MFPRITKVLLVTLALLLCAPLLAYTYGHQAALAIHEAIVVTVQTPTPELATAVTNIERQYHALPLAEVSTDDRVELGYEMVAWRRSLGARVLDGVLRASNAAEARSWLQVAVAARSAVTKEELAQLLQTPRIREAIAAKDGNVLEPLARWFSTVEAAGPLRADVEAWGFPEIAKTFGPAPFVDILPVKHSKWPFERWAKLPQAEDYAIEGDEVVYRGLRLRTGDVLLNLQAIDRDGLITSVTADRTFLSHVAVFVLVRMPNGHAIPAIFEMHELGVRAVPLAVAFSSFMTSYTEVYRRKETNPEQEARLGEQALALLQESQRYHMDAGPMTDTDMACSGLPACLWRRIGEETLEGKTKYDPRALQSLLALGLSDQPALTPNDYLQSDRLRLVGSVDNGHFEWDLARALTREAFRDLFATGTIAARYLPLSYKFHRYAVQKIQSDTKLGALFRRFTPFTPGTFPAGSPGIIALTPELDKQANAAVRSLWQGGPQGNLPCRWAFGRLAAPHTAAEGAPFSFHDFVASSTGKQLIQSLRTLIGRGLRAH